MFCSNCGAKVDDQAKFCPVCGNKLDKSSADVKSPAENPETVISKSTYESVQDNENLIKEDNIPKENKPKKESKFSKVFQSLKFKREEKPKAEENNPNDQSINDNKNFNDKYPVEGLVEKREYEMEMPPSYYGYNPIDDRKRKELRHQNTSYRQGSEDIAKKSEISNKTQTNLNIDDKSPKEVQSPKKENFLSVEERIAARLRGELGELSSEELPTYDDIPNEYLEARIARKIQEEKGISPAKTNYRSSLDRQANRPDNSSISNKYQAFEEKPIDNRSHEAVVNEEKSEKPVDQGPKNDEDAKDKKEPFRFKPIYLLPLLLTALALGIVYLLKNRAPDQIEVDLTQYMDVTFTGDDGLASPNASIDTSKLLSDHANDIGYVNKDRKDDSYGSAANQFVEELQNSTTFQFSKDNNLSNGEEITAVANISDSTLLDDYNVLFANTMKSVIVDGLITTESVDPFQYINVDFEGEDPNISLVTSIAEDAPEYMANVEIAPSKTSELTAGEEVNISLMFDEDEIFNTYGLKLSPVDQTFTVPGEASEETNEEETNEDPAEETGNMDGFISSVDSLDEDLLGTLKYNAGQLIKNTFNQRSFTQIGEINYLGAITGSDSNSDNMKNRVMLVYEIKANEDYEGRYTNEYTYYTFVEYQNVKDSKDENGEFYSEGPITTDNEIFHKFFVEDDYTYYEIPYYGFAFLEEVISRVNNSLSGLTIDDSIATDVTSYFETSDGVAGEYQGNGTRLSLKSDGAIRYQLDQRVHQGSWQDNDGSVTLTIEGVNVDTPINASFENGALNVPEQGEMSGQTFNKMQAMS